MGDVCKGTSKPFRTKVFTTQAKIRRRGHFISGDRCRAFMQHLWDKGLRKRASYATLQFEFQHLYETNDMRTVTRYLGRPRTTIRYSGISMVRMERQSGRLAQFEYHNRRDLEARKGLLEVLGFITDLKNGFFKLNHELFPYFSEQIILKEVPPSSPLQETDNNRNGSGGSNDNLCVCSIEAAENVSNISALKDSNVTREKEKKETIEGAHTNPYLYPNMLRKVSDFLGIPPKAAEG